MSPWTILKNMHQEVMKVTETESEVEFCFDIGLFLTNYYYYAMESHEIGSEVGLCKNNNPTLISIL